MMGAGLKQGRLQVPLLVSSLSCSKKLCATGGSAVSDFCPEHVRSLTTQVGTMSAARPNEDEDSSDADETVVHDAYLSCLRSFASCKNCPHLSQASQLMVEDEANRFDVWAVNTGSCLEPSVSSSLDHRLRNSHTAREMVVLVLRAIRVNLDYGTPMPIRD